MEIPVVATGAKPGGGSGNAPRELFCEDTTTVLVFEKGAVVRLAATVAPGQLVFLTNTRTKKEVVAQVMPKRSAEATNSYAELQFTENAPDFWGTEFSKSGALANVAEVAHKLPESHSAEFASRHPSGDVAPPAAEEVERLRAEVEELRLKLQKLAQPEAKIQARPQAAAQLPVADLAHSVVQAATQIPTPRAGTQGGTQGSAAVHAEAAPGSASAIFQAAAADESTKVAVVRPAGAPPGRELPAIALPKASENQEHPAPRSSLDAELGSLVHQSVSGYGEEQTPATRPQNFEKATNLKKARDLAASLGEKQHAVRGAKHKLRLMFLYAALAICAIGGAWYEQWLPAAVRSKLPAPGSILSFHSAAAPSLAKKIAVRGVEKAAASPPAAVTNAQPIPVTAKGADQIGAVASPPTAESADKTSELGPKESAHRDEALEKPERAAVCERKEEDRSEKAIVAKRERTFRGAGTPSGSADAAGSPAKADVAEAGVYVPPKLVKSVRPIAPAAAIRDYVSGNVELDALVSAEGRVISAKVLSGPEVLRESAIKTLREYRYKPATRGGKHVSGHVKVTLQYWYEP
jgi:TonB family protein